MNICIVEDNKLLLENLRLLLQGESDIHVIGAFVSAEEALSRVDWDQTDILLADIDLPGISGVDLIGRVKAAHDKPSALAYTICEDRAVVMAAIRAGACGYLLKGSTPRVLIESVRELHAGGAPMSPKIARKLMAEVRLQQSGETVPGAAPSLDLTTREISVLKLVEKGLSYSEIAGDLKLSPHTVHSHIKNIYDKIHATSRAEMLRKARQLGVI